MLKKISILLLLLMSLSIYSQKNNLEKYKYIIVANKFDFLKKPDQFQTSSLTKFLLEKKGFKVYLEGETLPEEIKNNRCAFLMAKVTDESNMLTTKNRIDFSDCSGKVVYTSKVGKSKIKDYKNAYHEAIRNAFNTIEDFDNNAFLSNKDDNKQVITVSKNKQQDITKNVNVVSPALKVLYAQAIENGFQLVNTKPEVVYKVLQTNLKDVFIINGKNGILYKVGEKWIAEFYQDNQLQQLVYDVKF
ncbi:hypothetical protein [Polaribacter sp.]|uniref:hypothetical protein n=1 Tax=Polaribacter sp. TaxID=1920175 RepID=UPI003F6CC3F3